ncbi:MAG: guanylate kinase [Flavobacteriales bacterium]
MNGKCVILAAPSGSGKTSIVHGLLEEGLELEFSISATSRPRRGKEEEGEDYYFLGPEEFRKRVDQGELIEWEEVYPDRFYGTLRSEVERIRREGKNVIFDVDVIGALNLKKQFGDEALALFIRPPSIEALEERIRGRGTDREADIQERLKKAKEEMAYGSEFDLVIKNEELDQAIADCREAITNFLAS